MRCLVTGAAGGIGHHLCKYLSDRGHEVFGLDDFSVGRNQPDCYMYRINIAVNMMPQVKFDWIFHLAARTDIVPSITDPRLYHRVNTCGTFSVLEYARRKGVKKFIYAASSSCYGIPDQYPTPETAPCNPQYPYALTKYLGEQYVLHYAQVYGLPAVSLRLFNVYGPGFRPSGSYGAVFGVFLAQMANGRPLTVVGDGTQSRDFTYVTDVCEALLRAAQAPVSGEIYNVGTGRPQSVNRLIELLGSPEKVHLPNRPGEPHRTQADITKIHEQLGWQPHVSFAEGVGEMLKHLPDYKDAPVWDPDSINTATKKWFECLTK